MIIGELPKLVYLPQLSERGPWATPDGRSTGFLADLHVDLQPAGWRIVDRPGLDERRRDECLSADIEALELAYLGGGSTAEVKVQTLGPWTLAAGLELTRGDKVLRDPGAVRDLIESLAEGIALHVAEIAARLKAEVVVQLEEPALATVMEGGVSTASGMGRFAAVERHIVQAGFQKLTEAIARSGASAILRVRADADIAGLISQCGFDGVALSFLDLPTRSYDELGQLLEAGTTIYAGCVTSALAPKEAVAPLRQVWQRLGLDPQLAATQVVVTPAHGLAESNNVVAMLSTAREAGEWLAAEPEEWLS